MRTIEVPEVRLQQQHRVVSVLRVAAEQLSISRTTILSAQSSVRLCLKRAWRLTLQSCSANENDWPKLALGDLIDVLDRARVALNAKQRAGRPGSVPYFGASGIIDRVDGSTHDEPLLLLSEDGANLISRRSEIAFVSDGPIWANNHIHVLRTRDIASRAFLAAYLNSIELNSFLTGTAQPKLPLNRLLDIQIPVPTRQLQERIVKRYREVRESLRAVDKRLSEAEADIENAWAQYLDDSYNVETVKPTTVQDFEATRYKKKGKLVSAKYDSIDEALRLNPRGLTPRALFDSLNYPEASQADAVDHFYSDLRELLERSAVTEERKGAEVLLVAS